MTTLALQIFFLRLLHLCEGRHENAHLLSKSSGKFVLTQGSLPHDFCLISVGQSWRAFQPGLVLGGKYQFTKVETQYGSTQGWSIRLFWETFIISLMEVLIKTRLWECVSFNQCNQISEVCSPTCFSAQWCCLCKYTVLTDAVLLSVKMNIG